jgi:hypothetical protein
MLLIVQQPHRAPEQIEVTQADGARLRWSGMWPILR